jgi:hypothetical protein
MLACDFYAFGMQLVGHLPDFRSCSISPCDGSNLPVSRKVLGDGATLYWEIPIDDSSAVIRAVDYLANGWRWVLIQSCLKYMQYFGRVHSALRLT